MNLDFRCIIWINYATIELFKLFATTTEYLHILLYLSLIFLTIPPRTQFSHQSMLIYLLKEILIAYEIIDIISILDNRESLMSCPYTINNQLELLKHPRDNDEPEPFVIIMSHHWFNLPFWLISDRYILGMLILDLKIEIA